MMMSNEAANLLPKPFNLSSRLSNAGTALGNIGKTMLQDSATLKTDIAFWATLMHTIMRVQEAYITGEVEPNDAKHQDMTPEEKIYRRNQSAMTYFREIVGVTLGWGVLKVGQAWQKDAMQKQHNYHNGSDYSVPVNKGLGQFWDALTKGTPIEPLPNVFTDMPTQIYKKYNSIDPTSQALKFERLDLSNPDHKMQKVDAQLVKWGHMLRPLESGEKDKYLWDKGFLRRVVEFFVPHADAQKFAKMANEKINHGLEDNNKALLALEERGFKFAQKFIPTVLWSIPGILFAGIWLERTTLYKGPSVQKWTVSALETLGIIDSSEDDTEALVDASKVAALVKLEPEKQKPLPPFPYYYADAVGASLRYHQALYGNPTPLPTENKPTMPSFLSRATTERTLPPYLASSSGLLPQPAPFSIEQEKPATAFSTIPSAKTLIAPAYRSLLNPSGFAL